ncbi:DUF1120 domain-containing protein [Serratia liquefaciens]|uniref:DUF1120 domain-containing protein n=2 Tax=Serratia liquefaciens TaxID=614 RepID=UPI00235E2E91|nr:DUF1120 domain-containing protein [Serratia liquefaciens]
MKNTIVRLSSIAAMGLFASNTMAGPGSVELKVQGQIGAPTCEIRFANGNGVVDLGKISINNIKENSESKLPVPAAMTVNAFCDAQTQLMFSVIDNRSATVSAPSQKHFGLGSINGSGKIGYYGIKMTNAFVDGQTVNVYSSPNKTSFTPAKEVDVEIGNVMGWAKVANQPLTGTTFSTQLLVIPHLASLKDMGGSVPEDTQVDGSATLNFSYAI